MLKNIAIIAAGQGAPQGDENYCDNGIPFVKAGNLVELVEGKPITEIQKVSDEVAKKHKLRLYKKGSVLFAKSGMSCLKGYVYVLPQDAYVVSHLACVTPNEDISEYLRYYFQYNRPNKLIKDEAYPSISLADIEELKIDIKTQIERDSIVRNLASVAHLIGLQKKQLQEFDTLIKSRFVEMFGDMLLNTMGWDESSLESIAEIVSGISKGRKVKNINLREVPYMAVSNVKDGYIDWTTIKTIMATEQEIEQYRLMPNDILMTEGGDPDTLGRGAIIKEPMENSIHQNHIFRVRLNRELILPMFFEEYLQHQKAKRYFLRCAKQTTGIASINMKQLRALPVLIPSLELQNQFATFVHQIDKLKLTAKEGLKKLEIMQKALMQQYFC